MLVRPITKEERLQSAQLFAIAFESPFDPNDLTPFAENPCIWAAFDEESGEMMSTVYVTDYRVQFDGDRYKMGGIGGVASLPQYRRAGGIRACFQKFYFVINKVKKIVFPLRFFNYALHFEKRPTKYLVQAMINLPGQRIQQT